MDDFVVRVELRGEPDEEAYTSLDDTMAAQGFLSTITDDAGLVLDLPDTTYYGSSTQSASDLSVSLRDLIVSTVWTDPIVFVAHMLDWGLASPE